MPIVLAIGPHVERIATSAARTQLADLVGRVTYGSARIVLTKHGKPVAVLVPIADLERLGQDAAGVPAAQPASTESSSISASHATETGATPPWS